jgi:hypothetical protein
MEAPTSLIVGIVVINAAGMIGVGNGFGVAVIARCIPGAHVRAWERSCGHGSVAR